MSMNTRFKILSCVLKKNHISNETTMAVRHQHQQCQGIEKVRLKWVKNRSIDHIIDNETDLKAACLLKDAIKRSSTGFLTSRSISEWKKLLGLTVPVLRFIRRYPTLFHEFPHARYPSMPCFRLTDTATMLDSQEQSIHEAHELQAVERLCRVLMMTERRMVPLQSLHQLKWDLGLPDDFSRTLIKKYPDHFQVAETLNGLPCLRLEKWHDEFAVSALQRSNENRELSMEYQQLKKCQTNLVFPMSFPRGYGARKKVKAWMDDFHKLPYISPYQDCSMIDPDSDLMEKRVVGLLHEFLSLTIHKKTQRNYLRSLREELNLPHRFTRIFTRYPGIFYLSLKCKTVTVTLREGYERGKLVDPHPLAHIRRKYHYVMRTGILYRGKGFNGNGDNEMGQEGFEEGDVETEDECCEEISELEMGSDEE